MTNPVTPHTAQIISLAAYRATHRKSVVIRFLLPSWPWGWFSPMVVSLEIA